VRRAIRGGRVGQERRQPSANLAGYDGSGVVSPLDPSGAPHRRPRRTPRPCLETRGRGEPLTFSIEYSHLLSGDELRPIPRLSKEHTVTDPFSLECLLMNSISFSQTSSAQPTPAIQSTLWLTPQSPPEALREFGTKQSARWYLGGVEGPSRAALERFDGRPRPNLTYPCQR